MPNWLEPSDDPPRHLYSITDLDRREMLRILDFAAELQRCEAPLATLTGKVVGLLFFQSSTRTRAGFHAAAVHLGATAVHLGTSRYDESMSEAENPVDAFRCISSYFDLIVLRHADELEFAQMLGSARVGVINGGCGKRHHPTQTLVDLFEVRVRMGRIDGLRWGIVGDLAGSRAARSLMEGLASFDVAELRLMSPVDRLPPTGEILGLERVPVRHLDRLDPAGLDVLYMAGYPSRPGSLPASADDRARFQLTTDRVRALPSAAAILCPMPRIDEIDRAVDELAQAAYFEQSLNGRFVRMALLQRALSFHSFPPSPTVLRS